ncbi:MAG: glycosyltransferase [Chitinophagaceae bacterium]|nr:glycosyltransferase [Chitinophagaceae bacterium]
MAAIFAQLMKSPKTILIVCNRVPFPLKDGGALAMYAMIKGWHSLGLQVHLLAMNTSRHRVSDGELPKLFGQLASCTLIEIDTDIKLLPTINNFFFSKKPQHAQRFYNNDFEQKLITILRATKPDVVQLESIYLEEYTTAIRKHSKALLLHRLHNIEAELWQRLAQQIKSFAKKFYLKNLATRIANYEQELWNTADALISISEIDEQYIKSHGCTKPVCNIPYGIEINPSLAVDHSSWSAYHIGAMDWQPNEDAMHWMQKEIAPKILETHPDFIFQFAGRNMPEKFVGCQEKAFQCMGEVADAEAFSEKHKVLFVPLSAGSGIRVKTLEAMAKGKVVISTSVGIQGISAKDKTHFLLANNTQEFADAWQWCQENKEAAITIGHNAQLFVNENYNQQLLMQQLQKFVETL